jgi:N-acetyl-anhydromuramyl-L-alanine amidase AmpD
MSTEGNPLGKPASVPPAIVASPKPLALTQVPAHRQNYSRTVRTPTLIVLHCTDGCEGGGATDTNVAAMFARPFPPGQKKRSAHYVVDADSCTACVPDLCMAWHCGHHGNAVGLGIELCGKASQTRREWLDGPSLATLNTAARLCADLCDLYQIPPALTNTRDLLAGKGGITTHSFVSEAWHESDHWDPGPGFPLGAFVVAVRAAVLP